MLNYLSASTTVTPKIEHQPADYLFSVVRELRHLRKKLKNSNFQMDYLCESVILGGKNK